MVTPITPSFMASVLKALTKEEGISGSTAPYDMELTRGGLEEDDTACTHARKESVAASYQYYMCVSIN